jgi:ABC-type transport system involved in multi-copper enzyme maturation permease subunit
MNGGSEPLHARVAEWLERAFNPIMVKELRASMRGARFFVAHVTILALFACGILLAFAVEMSRAGRYYEWGYGYGGDPSDAGRVVYGITQLLHLAVVFLVVPGLAATSITGERESLTHELLLSTTLTARQIVWGKFTAAMTQTFTIFISMVPLVGLCFLFGGITVYQILANYAFLFGLSALMIAFALSISANARGTQRAVGTVYGLAVVSGVVLACLAAAFERSGLLAEAAVAYGFLSPGHEMGIRQGRVTVFERIMYVHVAPAFVWTAFLSLFFINATNRLKPIFADRSTNLRVYYGATLFGAGALTLLIIYHELPPATNADDRSVAVMGYTLATLMTSLVSALFACEEPVLPAALAARSRRHPLSLLLGPGSGPGTVFCLAANGAFLAASFAAFVPYSGGFDRGTWIGLPGTYPLGVAFVTAFLWAFFCAAFGRFLSVALYGRPVLLRTILILTCLFLAVFPLVHWAVATGIDRDELDPAGRRGPVTLGFSPAAAILSALDLGHTHRDFPLLAGPLPVPALFSLFALGSGTALIVLAERAASRLRAALARGHEAAPETAAPQA